MKRRFQTRFFAVALVVTALGGALYSAIVWAQDAPDQGRGADPAVRVPDAFQVNFVDPLTGLLRSSAIAGPDSLGGLRARLLNAKSAIKAAGTEEERQQATEKLDPLLNEYFDKDMEQRKQELADIKERVATLEKQLQQREAAKGDIVALQKKVIINEADGLGFFDRQATDPFLTKPISSRQVPETPREPVFSVEPVN